ncbi:MAG: class I SAM-dependent methyltransferase [Candidatus Aminicenantes bacterium]|nr:MAG: class I SAM-dependent methyltransferase [Candidatus Aminicenantes bacterium]
MKRTYFKPYLLFVILMLMALDVMVAQKSEVPEESWEKRFNKIQPPEKIMDAIGLKEGMTIGDIGAGRGRFAVWFSARVGESGKVYANDINKGVLDHIERRCERNNIRNIITVLGEVEDPLLPEGELDIAFMINVYHHLDKPVKLVRNTIPSLKPNGILAIVERDQEKAGGVSWESTPKKRLIEQVESAGYKLVKVDDSLEEDYLYIFRVK